MDGEVLVRVACRVEAPHAVMAASLRFARYVHNLLKYEFDLQFEIPVTYPATAPELELPELDGKPQQQALQCEALSACAPLAQARRPRCTAAARFA